MNRFEHGGKFLFGVQVRGRSDANRPDDGGAEVGENIAEKVRANNDVEPVGMTDKVRGQDVYMELVRADVRILRGHRTETSVPEWHGMDDAVRFRCRCQMPVSLAGQFESVAHNAIDATTRENSLLHRDFVIGSFVKAAADVGVFAFVVFTDDAEFNLTGLPVFERALNSFKQPYWPQIDVLKEAATDWNQEPPQGCVVGNVRVSNGAEKNGVKRPELLDAIRGHHLPSFDVGFTAPV